MFRIWKARDNDMGTQQSRIKIHEHSAMHFSSPARHGIATTRQGRQGRAPESTSGVDVSISQRTITRPQAVKMIAHSSVTKTSTWEYM